jgi:hypothetical protein
MLMEPLMRGVLAGGEQAIGRVRPWLRVQIQSPGSFVVNLASRGKAQGKQQPRLLKYQELGGSPTSALS